MVQGFYVVGSGLLFVIGALLFFHEDLNKRDILITFVSWTLAFYMIRTLITLDI